MQVLKKNFETLKKIASLLFRSLEPVVSSAGNALYRWDTPLDLKMERRMLLVELWSECKAVVIVCVCVYVRQRFDLGKHRVGKFYM